MKRILSFMMLLVAALTLVACTEVESTLEITQMPPTEFTVDFEDPVEFKFKADKDVYTVTWLNNAYSYKLNDAEIGVPLVEAAGISITPMDFATEGTKTVIIKYDKLTAQFQYVVKPVVAPVGDGTAANPFRIYNAADLITKIKAVAVPAAPLTDAAKAVTYFKLESDLDFAAVNEALEITTAYIQIDGAKALGGNYKISNLKQTLFGHIYSSTLRNIDIVDAVTKEHIVGAEGYNMTIDNVNILGNSFTSEAAYFDNLHGKSTISNSKNYATVIDRGGTAAGFIRRVDNDKIANSELTITNSFNYGTIQSANISARIGGLVSTSGAGKVIIKQSGNLGKVELYVSATQKALVDQAVVKNAGAYALVGHNIGSTVSDTQTWVHEDHTAHVEIDAASLANARENAIKVYNASFYADMSGMAFLTGIATLVENPTLSHYRLMVIASGTNHTIVNGKFETVKGGGGMINIFDKVYQQTDMTKVAFLTMDDLKAILANPYAQGISATMQTPGKINVDPTLAVGALGYDAYDKGNYRVAGLSQTLIVQYYGYNAQNELVFVASGKVAVTASQS